MQLWLLPPDASNEHGWGAPWCIWRGIRYIMRVVYKLRHPPKPFNSEGGGLGVWRKPSYLQPSSHRVPVNTGKPLRRHLVALLVLAYEPV